MNLSLADTNGSVLAISQFMFYGDVRNGGHRSITLRRRSYQSNSTNISWARFATPAFPAKLGRFKAMLQVELLNDGPVTILQDSGGVE